MINTVTKLFVIIMFLIPAYAAETWHTSKIKNVYVVNNGNVILIFENDHPSCKNANKPQYFTIAKDINFVTEAGLQRMYSAALTAAAAGKHVVINFESESTDCPINRLSVKFD